MSVYNTIKGGYSSSSKIGDYGVSSHVFEVFLINGREIRADAGIVRGTRGTYVGTLMEGSHVIKQIVEPFGECEHKVIFKLKKLAGEVIR